MDSELEELVRSCLDLAAAIAVQEWRKAPQALQLDELKGYANLGLVMAATRWPVYCAEKGYNPAHTQYFKVFAKRRIRGAIIDALRSQDFATRSVRSRAKKLAEAGQNQGASVSELVERTGLDTKEIDSTNSALAQRPVSLEAEGIDVESVASSVEGSVLTEMLLKVFVSAFRELSFEKQVLLSLKYYRGLELREVAQLMGMPDSRASSLHTQSVLEIHKIMSDSVKERDE